jgi:selenocysteine lyase/cysteine desulfurase
MSDSLTDERFDFSIDYNISDLRALVPVVCRRKAAYLNASMQHPINNRVRHAIDEFLDHAQMNPRPKPQWLAKTVATRELLGTFLNVSADSLSFTRDTTEGMNLFQRSIHLSEGDNVVLLDVEHVNQTYGWLALKEAGLEVRLVPTQEDTCADASTFAPFVDDRTCAIGLSSVMFHSGQMNNVKDVCAFFRPRGIHVLVDMTQHVGVMPIDLADIGASAVAFSCHKALGCPTGLGVLYIDPNTFPMLKATPPMAGGGAVSNMAKGLIVDPNVEYHNSVRRYDHLNPAFVQIAALNASLKFLTEEVRLAEIENHLRSLGRQLVLMVEQLGVEVVGSRRSSERAPHVYVFKLMHPDWQAHFIDDDIFVSYYQLGVRVSFGFYNDMSDIRAFVSSLERGILCGIPLG